MAVVASFWLLAISLTFYNKWVFSSYGFRFPLSYCLLTFTTQLASALLVQYSASCSDLCHHMYHFEKQGTVKEGESEREAGDDGAEVDSSDQCRGTPSHTCCDRQSQFVIVIGLCSVLEIAGSNLSLLTLGVAFHTIVKSSTPIFVLIWAVGLGVQAPNPRLVSSVICVTVGIVLAAAGGDANGETDDGSFAWDGFLYLMASANAGGIRWAMCQKMLQNSGARLQPVPLMIAYTPYCIAALPVMISFLEMPEVFEFLMERGSGYLMQVVLIAVVCGLGAFLLLFSELVLIRLTSSLTLSIAAVCKELLIVILSVGLGKESLHIMNIVGFGLCIVGVCLYKLERARSNNTVTVEYQKLNTSLDSAFGAVREFESDSELEDVEL